MIPIRVTSDELNKAILKWLGLIEGETIQSLQDDLMAMEFIPDIADYITEDEEDIQLDAHKHKELLEQLHSKLTNREKQCFTLHVAEKLSMNEIAREIGVSKSSVQEYIERARKKINAI
jgi:RNA polymerase sigma-70 factor (ECF subfamily)